MPEQCETIQDKLQNES